MRTFDKKLRRMATEEPSELPASAKERIASLLVSLPEWEVPEKHVPSSFRQNVSRAAMAVACTAVTALVILPNISPAYAQTMERIPVLGELVRVVTIRNYFYEDDHRELNVEVPEIREENDGAAAVNRDIDAWTSELVAGFYDELEISGGNGYGSIYVDYETVTDTERWFTLKLSVYETAASSNSYFRYYHIDKATGEEVHLDDLFADEKYSDILAEEIRSQMREQMEADEAVVYWLDDPDPEFSFTSAALEGEHNFYFTENGELVIPFDKYEVAPGYMGSPSFVIPASVTDDLWAKAFTDIP